MLEQTVGPWDYRMLPNKLLELVKNVGNIQDTLCMDIGNIRQQIFAFKEECDMDVENQISELISRLSKERDFDLKEITNHVCVDDESIAEKQIF